MTTTTHGTFIIERRYDAAPERVFAAWSDPSAKRIWLVEGEGWEIQHYALDFREGGGETSTYRFLKGKETFGEETSFGNETVYTEIVANERIIFTYSMSRNGVRFSVSIASVEFSQAEKGTRLVFTEHGAFFDGADGVKMREEGWQQLLSKLGQFLGEEADAMGRLIIWNIMSLDGAFEGATPWDLSMHETVWGPELEALSKEQLADSTILLFGRRTYEGMFEYWSKETETGEITDGMNGAPKAVVSTTLKSADWNNSRLLRSIDDVKALKRETAEKNIFVFGSAQLTSSLRDADLIDEYRICIAPLLLGKTGGAPMFKPTNERLRLNLIEARPITGGGVVLFYEPQR